LNVGFLLSAEQICLQTNLFQTNLFQTNKFISIYGSTTPSYQLRSKKKKKPPHILHEVALDKNIIDLYYSRMGAGVGWGSREHNHNPRPWCGRTHAAPYQGRLCTPFLFCRQGRGPVDKYKCNFINSNKLKQSNSCRFQSRAAEKLEQICSNKRTTNTTTTCSKELSPPWFSLERDSVHRRRRGLVGVQGCDCVA
jgi:hypothetical protein